jgi:hypothetical protein
LGADRLSFEGQKFWEKPNGARHEEPEEAIGGSGHGTEPPLSRRLRNAASALRYEIEPPPKLKRSFL